MIAVKDIKKAIGKVVKAGGKVLGEPMEIPGVGNYVSFLDPEGTRVSILEPIPMNWHGPAKKPTPKTAVKKAAKRKAGMRGRKK